MRSRIIFMGTPDYAVASLEALIAAGANIVGVFTQPDKPKGRKLLMTPPPVKVCALEHGLKVFQPSTLRSDEAFELIKSLEPDMIAVAAYGKLLPENVIKLPKYGCINVHGSLLPKYRGAAPIQRAIIDGESETGVTIMYMDVGLDTGDMLAKKAIPILENDNFETIHDKLADEGAKLLIKVIEDIEAGAAVREKQDDLKSSYAKKIENSDCILSFDEDVTRVHDRIRGLSPFPLAVCEHNGRALKLIGSEIAERERLHKKPGEVLKCDAKNDRIEVACAKGSLYITGVLPEGKGRMKAADYINGRKIEAGDTIAKYTL